MDMSSPATPISNNDIIAQSLNIADVPVVITPALPAVVSNSTPDEDFSYATKNLKQLVERGNKALDEIAEVASLSQHPRAYEVLAVTLKTVADINKQVTDIAKDRTKLHPEPTAGAKNVTNHNVFVGSTAELAAFMDQRRGR